MNEIEQVDGKWYFYDETWSTRYGPFDTEEEVKREFAEYCKHLEEWESREEKALP